MSYIQNQRPKLLQKWEENENKSFFLIWQKDITLSRYKSISRIWLIQGFKWKAETFEVTEAGMLSSAHLDLS
jgi:hypothetical protein